MKRIISLLSVPGLVLLFCLPALSALPESIQAKMGSVSGRIFVDDQPQALAVVSFFLEKNGLPPVAGGMRRVPEFLSRTDSEANFKANLMAGNYYLGVLDRDAKSPPGPPRPGEKFHFAADAHGQLLVLAVSGREHLAAGRINAAPPTSFSAAAQFFTVVGMVRSEAGEPVPEVAVLGKSRLNIPRPEFISDRTGQDGRFSLKLPAGKPFYLVAREDIAASRPLPGSYVGTYGIHSKTGLATLSMFSAGSPPPGVLASDEESRAVTVSGASGETVGGIDIFMYQVPDPEVIKQSVQGSVESPKLDQGVQIKNILFAPQSSDLNDSSRQELDRWVSFLVGQEQALIEIIGHTDNLGTLDANLLLSENRAMSVAAYLVSAGVAPERIMISGMGGGEPVGDNGTAEGRARNRRVEIRFSNLVD